MAYGEIGSLRIVLGEDALKEVRNVGSASALMEPTAQTQAMDGNAEVGPLEPPSTKAKVSSRVFIKSVPKSLLSITSVYVQSFLAQVGEVMYTGSAQALVNFTGPKSREAYIYIYDYDQGKTQATTASFDENGNLPILLQTSQEGSYLAVVSLVRLPNAVIGRPMAMTILTSTPLATSARITFWHVRSSLTNKTDVWARWHGRAVYNLPLPGIFWRPTINFIKYVVGLAGGLDWREIIPVVQNMNVGYQVGVSAFCNTEDPNPPADVCCEARKNTWWHAKLMARKSVREQWQVVGEDDINLSYRITAYFTTTSYSYNGRCVNKDVACGWEQGPTC